MFHFPRSDIGNKQTFIFGFNAEDQGVDVIAADWESNSHCSQS